jgi:hypothetical protein
MTSMASTGGYAGSAQPDPRTASARSARYAGTTFAERYGEFDCDAHAVDRLTGEFTRICAEFLGDLRVHIAGT